MVRPATWHGICPSQYRGLVHHERRPARPDFMSDPGRTPCARKRCTLRHLGTGRIFDNRETGSWSAVSDVTYNLAAPSCDLGDRLVEAP